MGYRRASGVYRGRGPRDHRFEDAEGGSTDNMAGSVDRMVQPGMVKSSCFFRHQSAIVISFVPYAARGKAFSGSS